MVNRLARICISSLIILGAVLGTAHAYESSSYGILGFSEDGKYMAFQVVASSDMAGPYPVRNEVFIVDVAANDFAVQ